MSVAADRPTGSEHLLVDVSGMSLEDILSEGSALAGALRRLEAETRSHEGLYAGFGNFTPDEEPDPPAVVSAPQCRSRQ